MDATASLRARSYQSQGQASLDQLKHVRLEQLPDRHARFAKLIRALTADAIEVECRILMSAQRGPTSLHGPIQASRSGRLSVYR